MVQNVVIPKAQIKVRGLVRDKHGRPKFEDPAMIKDFLHRLSDEDLDYLENKHGQIFRNK